MKTKSKVHKKTTKSKKVYLANLKKKYIKKCALLMSLYIILALTLIPLGIWLFIWSFQKFDYFLHAYKGHIPIFALIGGMIIVAFGCFMGYKSIYSISCFTGKNYSCILSTPEELQKPEREPKGNYHTHFNGFKTKVNEDEFEDEPIYKRRTSGVIIGSSKNISSGDVVRIGKSKSSVILGGHKNLKSGDTVIVNGKTKVIVGGHKEIKSGDWVELI